MRQLIAANDPEANDIRMRLRAEIRRRINRVELDFSGELFPIVVNVQFVNSFALKGVAAFGDVSKKPTKSRIPFDPNVGQNRGLLVQAVLALLLCAIPARAGEPTVIKDSEAIKYVGKEAEVCGRVVSVTTSPLGTAFINFGGEYPNQTFAGFIAAGSKIVSNKSLSMIHGKTISITGTIRLRDGKPEIEIVSADQITGLESQTEQ